MRAARRPHSRSETTRGDRRCDRAELGVDFGEHLAGLGRRHSNATVAVVANRPGRAPGIRLRQRELRRNFGGQHFAQRLRGKDGTSETTAATTALALRPHSRRRRIALASR